MTAEEQAFLELICASPEDDAPRLIYADWLDEHDNPRGEFIRLQCTLARLSPDDPVRPQLVELEATYLARYHARWSEPLKGLADWTEYDRGFIDTVNIVSRKFLDRGSALFALAPIRHVRFLDVGSSLSRLTNSPLLEKLTSITIFAQHLGEELAHALIDSPFVGNVAHLNIGRNRIGDRGIQRLARSPRFAGLQSLDLSDNVIHDHGIRAVAECSAFTKLNSLELRRNEITRNGLASICSSALLSQLTTLGIGLNYIGAPFEVETPSVGTVHLRSLDISESGLMVDSLAELLDFPGLFELHHLNLANNEIGNAGAALLAEWSGAAQLESLCLNNNRIGDEGIRSLSRSNYLHHLHTLDIRDNPFHDAGAFEILNSTKFGRLKALSVPYLGLTKKMRGMLAMRYSR